MNVGSAMLISLSDIIRVVHFLMHGGQLSREFYTELVLGQFIVWIGIVCFFTELILMVDMKSLN